MQGGKILVNYDPWQRRVAVIEEGKLTDVYFESESTPELERTIFKGKVTRILPGIQTAFVDIGIAKAGFLHISDIDRTLASERIFDLSLVDELEDSGKKFDRLVKKSMDIEKILRQGEELLVQVIKEPIHEKGPKLSTCFTIPGKYVVLMPNIPHIGASKKIESRQERERLKTILTTRLPRGMGAIARTTSEGKSEDAIKRDLSVLLSYWKSALKRFKNAGIGERVYSDLPIHLRVLREHFDESIDVVLVDDERVAESMRRYMKIYSGDLAARIKYYDGTDIFEEYGVDREIESALRRKVALPSGGSIVIEGTEAMTVIDVNTGRNIGKTSLEDTILQTNIEAANEVIRQLRLRNIGGIIVIDFIDMNSQTNRKKLSQALEDAIKKKDKFQSVALKISEFGLVQMTRKRSGKTLMQQLTTTCEYCGGVGAVRSPQNVTYSVLRKVKQRIEREGLSGKLVLTVSPVVYNRLVSSEYRSMFALEEKFGCKFVLSPDENIRGGKFKLQKK